MLPARQPPPAFGCFLPTYLSPGTRNCVPPVPRLRKQPAYGQFLSGGTTAQLLMTQELRQTKGNDPKLPGDGWRGKLTRAVALLWIRLRYTLGFTHRFSMFSSWVESLKQGEKRPRRILYAMLLVFCALVWLGARGLPFSPRAPKPLEVSLSEFLRASELRDGATIISNLQVHRQGHLTYQIAGVKAVTHLVSAPEYIVKHLRACNLDFRAAPLASLSGLLAPLGSLLYLCGLYWVIQRSAGNAAGSAGKLAAEEVDRSLSFEDVAGIDSAKNQIQEIVAMLRDPSPYKAAGARVPSGVLLCGPPGTGKTLLARVMAAEADVPYFYASGSDFVEMFVGRGAARVRKLFKQAIKRAPCILFVDELDALGRARMGGMGRSNDEAEQTLNQLLACMDGLDTTNNGVMVLAATNRYEILDEALVRPGRFDRVVQVSLPSVSGRLEILKVHCRKLDLHPAVRLSLIADMTPGLSGAELAAITNEAAILAARRREMQVTQQDLMEAAQQYILSRRRRDPLSGLIRGLLPS